MPCTGEQLRTILDPRSADRCDGSGRCADEDPLLPDSPRGDAYVELALTDVPLQVQPGVEPPRIDARRHGRQERCEVVDPIVNATRSSRTRAKTSGSSSTQ